MEAFAPSLLRARSDDGPQHLKIRLSALLMLRHFVSVGFLLLAWLSADLASAATPVILISIDTLRADHLSAYGYRAIRTPNIDALADHGTLYANADAQVPLTLPSHASLFTSTYPFQTGIRENAQKVSPGVVTLASVLRSKGYATDAFIASVFLEKEMRLDQGFDFYDSPFEYTAFSPLAGSVFYGGIASGPNVGKDRRDAPLVTRAALQWLRQNQGKPTFAFVHLYDLHKPYRLESYDAELAFVDQVIGNFQRSLAAMGMWEKSIVILLSDHGESLGEHREESHGYFIYESTLHVPLIFHLPESLRRSTGSRNEVTSPVALMDVAPTLLDLLQIPAPPAFAGKSFLHATPESVYGESFHAHDAFGWAALRSLRRGSWKYIQAPTPELYDLQTDPKESRNLYGTNRARGEQMRTELNRLLTERRPAQLTHHSDGNSQNSNQALLNSLGYLSGAPASKTKRASGKVEADPKERLNEYRLYEDAIFAQSRGRKRQAASMLETLLRQDPANTLAQRDLGGFYLDQGNFRAALKHLELAANAAPDDYATQFQLGLTYKKLNNNEAAEKHLNIACHLAPSAQQCRKELESLSRKK